jgi:hypothetical protein
VPNPGDLEASLTLHANTTEAGFTNHSATCSYPIGLAIYRKLDEHINHQQLHDYRLAVIPPNSTLVLTVNNPSCAFQVDAFWGNILYSLAGGVRYDSRLLDDADGNGRNYCSADCPTNTPTITPRPVTATSTAQALVVTPTATATSTPVSAPACTITFSDMPPGNPFYSFVRCLACRGILSGYSDGTYRPNSTMTRGQVAKLIANAAGYTDTIPATRQTFHDVPSNSPFWLYIERVAAHGVISGYSDNTFRPANSVTRGQAAKFVANAAGYTGSISPTQQTFHDVDPHNPFWLFIERVAAQGVVAGYADGTFRPNNSVTRGQTAKFVGNAFFPDCQTPRTH